MFSKYKRYDFSYWCEKNKPLLEFSFLKLLDIFEEKGLHLEETESSYQDFLKMMYEESNGDIVDPYYYSDYYPDDEQNINNNHSDEENIHEEKNQDYENEEDEEDENEEDEDEEYENEEEEEEEDDEYMKMRL